MSRDVSGERGESGGAMRRLSREAAIGDSHAAAATATTSSSRRVSSSVEQQHVAVATTTSSQQQATRVATAASSTHLHAEDAGTESQNLLIILYNSFEVFFWLRMGFRPLAT
jgi:hypothetical protein